MKIYIDFVLFINFFFDFLILLTVSIILKRNKKIYRILLGSLIGSLSVLILFININSFTLFLIKLLISILMIIISFGYKDFIKNFLYLYFVSIILGGCLYFINNIFSYRVEGLLFINNGFSLNLIILLIISPIIIYIYIKENRKNKVIQSNIYNVTIKYLGNTYNYRAYLDTGNNLYDPYMHRPVCILYDKNIEIKNVIYIPYRMISENGMLKGFKVDEMVIDDKVYKNVLIGLTDNYFNLSDCSMILHSSYF